MNSARPMVSALFLACAICRADAQTKLALFARLDLNANTSVGAITNAHILTGDGAVDRQFWLSGTVQPRTYTISLPVFRFAWTEFKVQFLPLKSGIVTNSLLGTWEETTPGSGIIYRQEVLWDAMDATGTRLNNGSFETVGAGGISGWTGGTSQTTNASVPGVEGARMARTWVNSPLSCTLSVTGNVPVTLHFFSRAVVPSGFVDMQRIADRHTPAHQAALKFARGINLGNYLEYAANSPGLLSYSAQDFALIRNEGFDHVRVPIGWFFYAGPAPDYTLSNSIFSKVDFLVTNALNKGLGAILDIHHFDDFTANPAGWTNQFYAIWRQVAAHYSNAPSTVAFELLNEPKDLATTKVMNPIYAEAVRQIRQISPNRTLFLAPGNFNSIDELNSLLLPDNDTNLIAAVHCYDPFYFTHQGAEWVMPDMANTNVLYAGPPPAPLTPNPIASNWWVVSWIAAYNTEPTEFNPSSARAFRGKLQRARLWSDYFGRPVQVGEFGSYEKADPVSRVTFYREIRHAMDEQGLGWAMWDWKAGFHYIKNGLPDPPGMRAAMFPPFQLLSLSKGHIEFDAAIGKTFRVDKTLSLAPPAWRSVSTQTLTSPKFLFSDPAAGQLNGGYYRVVWIK